MQKEKFIIEKDNLSYWLFGSLFFMFSARCWVSLFPSINLPILSTIFGVLSIYVPLFTFCLAFFYNQAKIQTVEQRGMIILFIVFLSYCAFYIANPQTSQIQAVPETVGDLVYKSFPLCLMIFLSGAILEKCDIILFAKISVITILFFLLVYFCRFNIALYGLMYGLSDDEKEFLAPEGFLGALTMTKYLSLACCSNLFLSDKWTEKSSWNKIITISISVVLLFIQFMLIERGPILSMTFITIFYFLCRKVISGKKIIILVVAALILFFFQDVIISILSSISSSTIEKFANTNNNGGNGRFGSDDALFPAALAQISEGPFFGTYFRTKYGILVGAFPHNFILEFLMIFGFVFSTPLFILMYKAAKRTYQNVNKTCFLFGLLFVNCTLLHLTSGTVIGDNLFWLSFSIILAVNYNK